MSSYILIDTMNLIHRVRHAFHGDAYTKVGMYLHVLFTSLLKSWNEVNADHAIFCLDRRSWRRDFFPQYKAHRCLPKLLTPSEIEENNLIQETLDELIDFITNKSNCTILGQSGLEADDLIAGWVQGHPTDNHIILSSDSDFFQLIAPNVSIYDGIKKWHISYDTINTQEFGEVNFTIHNGKIKIYKPNEPIGRVRKPNWPMWCLFTKCIRGDATDGIPPAFVGVREYGSIKKPGISEAFEDRVKRGYNWNNMMLTEVERIINMDENGNVEMEKTTVLKNYEFNQKLIDLSKQPKEIRSLINDTIAEQSKKEKKTGIGFKFMQFCNEHDLVSLSKNPGPYAKILNSALKEN